MTKYDVCGIAEMEGTTDLLRRYEEADMLESNSSMDGTEKKRVEKDEELYYDIRKRIISGYRKCKDPDKRDESKSGADGK